MKTKYTHLLIDLDHTLWDFNENCKLTMFELYEEYIEILGLVDKESFYTSFLKINTDVWSLYDHNKITKEELRVIRFRKLLNEFGVGNDSLAAEMEDKYLFRCPKKGGLLPNALEFVEKVKGNFEICLITNGFQQTQEEKVLYSGLDKYFAKMFTSESTGYKKPDVNYFKDVLAFYDLRLDKCLVIGDNPFTDIQGAKNIGVDSLWVNTQNFPKTMQCTYYVKDLASAIKLF